jgi:hypothetical protein
LKDKRRDGPDISVMEAHLKMQIGSLKSGIRIKGKR